jgi:hypothetical protein
MNCNPRAERVMLDMVTQIPERARYRLAKAVVG